MKGVGSERRLRVADSAARSSDHLNPPRPASASIDAEGAVTELLYIIKRDKTFGVSGAEGTKTAREFVLQVCRVAPLHVADADRGWEASLRARVWLDVGSVTASGGTEDL